MSKRIQDGYIYSTAVILFVTAAIKFFSAAGNAPVLNWLDPLLPFSNRQVFIFGGTVELGISVFLCLGSERISKTMLIGWLAVIYLIYRLGLWWAGAPSLCHCLGNLSDRFPISPLALDRIVWAVLGWLCVGSCCFLVLEWFRNRK
jgi:hypothetical protein